MGVEDAGGTLVVGPGTPYITPDALKQAATGISWGTLPSLKATPSEQLAAQLDICTRATAMVDAACNQPLRATVDTETLVGPGSFRCQVQKSGVARLLLSRSPVTSVVSGRVTGAASFPASWSTIPADQFRPERPMIGVYGTSAPSGAGEGGQAVRLAPGWVGWSAGRDGCEIEVTYINGWPHAAVATAATAAGRTLVVDDITGWTGASGVIYDNDKQETITCSSVTPATAGAISGPGTLNLASALSYAHASGVLVTTLPGTVIQASVLFAVSQALVRGATATTVQSITGGSSSGGSSPKDMADRAAALVHPFRRVI